MFTPLHGNQSHRLTSSCYMSNNCNLSETVDAKTKIQKAIQTILDQQEEFTPNSRLYLQKITFGIKQLHLIHDAEDHNNTNSFTEIVQQIQEDSSTQELEEDELIELTTPLNNSFNTSAREDSVVAALGDGSSSSNASFFLDSEQFEAPSSEDELGDSDNSDFEGPNHTSLGLVAAPKKRCAKLEIDPKDDRVGAVFSLVIQRENKEDNIFFAYTKRELSVRLKEIDRRAHGNAKRKTQMERALAKAHKVTVFLLYTKEELNGTKQCKARTALAKLVSPYKNQDVLNCWKRYN